MWLFKSIHINLVVANACKLEAFIGSPLTPIHEYGFYEILRRPPRFPYLAGVCWVCQLQLILFTCALVELLQFFMHFENAL